MAPSPRRARDRRRNPRKRHRRALRRRRVRADPAGDAAAGAIAVAEKVRAAIEAECPDGDPLTVSAGVACAPDDGKTAGDLFRAADARLYAAKAAGGNRVVSADG